MKRRIRILRIATRLNTGGPTVCLATLARGLNPERYEQWLAAGHVGPGERQMRSVVEAHGIRPIRVPGLVGTARFGPSDLAAIFRTRRLIHELSPTSSRRT
jgi:hypothetical protein